MLLIQIQDSFSKMNISTKNIASYT